jgi:hypothetical protein
MPAPDSSLVMRGFNPRIHLLGKMLDCPTKPGNNGEPISA